MPDDYEPPPAGYDLVLEPARAALRKAVADNPNDPEIVVLMPDGVDHLHITVLGPGDRR